MRVVFSFYCRGISKRTDRTSQGDSIGIWIVGSEFDNGTEIHYFSNERNVKYCISKHMENKEFCERESVA